MNFFNSLPFIGELKAAFAPPDPKRFAGLSTPPQNWNGELVGKKGKKSGVIDMGGGVYEFASANAYESIDIEPTLTAADRKGLRDKNLNPDNPNYTTAKAYFAKNPGCSKKDMANASGIGPETAKDVIAVFNRNIFSSPTPER